MRYAATICLLIAVISVGAFSGCQCAPKVPPSPGVPALVDVGGAVKLPGTVAIPDAGLTLLQGIIRAGGLGDSYQRAQPTNGDANPLAEILLVRLQRGREVHYFPLKMVETDLAGAVQLARGDIVQVLPATDTSLYNTIEVDSSLPVSIDGIHQLSGQFSIDRLRALLRSQTDPLGGKQIGSLFSATSRNSLATRNGVTAPVVMLTRTDARNGYVLENFVLPTIYYDGFSQGASDGRILSDALSTKSDAAAIQAGDRYLFTRLEAVPIVGAGVLAPVLQKALSTGAGVTPGASSCLPGLLSGKPGSTAKPAIVADRTAVR